MGNLNFVGRSAMKAHLEDADSTFLDGRGIFTTENLIAFSVVVSTLAIYIKTLCPTVYWWDSGEFIANIAILGIPHRPGFPVYMLLGKVFCWLPLGSFAFRINLMSALFASLSLGIFFKIFVRLTNLLLPQKAKRETMVWFSSLLFVLILGFTYSFWIQAVRAEVYSLNLLFFSLLLFITVEYLQKRESKHLYLFFFIFGLGLGNHHLSLLSTLPALLFLIFFAFRANVTESPSSVISNPSFVNELRKLPLYLVFLLLGLSIYLYLSVRSLSHPVLAWGETKSISSSAGSVFAVDTLKHLNFDFLSNGMTTLSHIFGLLLDQLTLPCFALSLVGFFLLYRHGRKTLVFLLLLVLGNCAVVLFMTTDFIATNPDLHGYLLFSVFAFAFSGGLAVFLILNGIAHSSFAFRRIIILSFVLFSVYPLFKHYSESDLSSDRMAADYGKSAIADLDSNSVLFADNVNLNFVLRELQYAEGMRTDVTVIDRGLLGFDWYIKQKRAEQKDLFSDIPDNWRGEKIFYRLLSTCLDLNRQVYMEFTERDSGLVNRLTPAGYVFKVSPTRIDSLADEAMRLQKRWDASGPFDLGSKIFQKDWDAQRVFALSFYRLGLFYEWKGMFSLALDQFNKVREVDPGNEEIILKTKHLETLRAKSDSLS
jgi:hypothetical protein